MSRAPDVSVVPTTTSYHDQEIRECVRALAASLGWGARSTDESAFAAVVPEGARVVVKPNWVLHTNRGPWNNEPLVTHGSVVRAVVEEALRSRAGRVAVGDAPIQECDFPALLNNSGVTDWANTLRNTNARFVGPLDFRRTKAVDRDGVHVSTKDAVSLDQFVLFDLGPESLLEPITKPGHFRVTQYPPAEMARTHAPGRHQYLVAREIIEADVVINLPKLKTHKKAGVTCALKNLIGINGNKEFLPHHRVGGAAAGGDCYPHADSVKRLLEFTYDQQNSTGSHTLRRAWNLGARVLHKAATLRGDELGVEGSWSGNDTIWRTCLDLNRILLYGRLDGTLADTPQRRELHIVDAVIAGQGEGPLQAEPLALGLLLGSDLAAAVDLVGARLLGYDHERIPIVAHAFDKFRWPLASMSASEVTVTGALGSGFAVEVSPRVNPGELHYPIGWRDAAITAAPAR